jgi:endo-1,4-beta-mannosidase
VPRAIWSQEQAQNWCHSKKWMLGCDFIPSTAINQLEMWQAETFDSVTINRELGWAANIGFNTVRVYLHHLAWQIDSTGFKSRMDHYLEIANKHGISTIFVFFDDCWNPKYNAGKQPEPKPGIHNSGWVRDPGDLIHIDPAIIFILERYMKDVLSSFSKDKRILLWDLYNEPGNSGYGNASLPLLKKAYEWARTINPSQPLSSGVWNYGLKDLNDFQVKNADIITYHNYDNDSLHRRCIDTLKRYNRPLICTEYMARKHNSRFFNITPLLKAEKIGALNWGLVAGRTNTIYAWDTPIPDGSEPKLWFHDIFRKNGSPYIQEEVEFLKRISK